MIGSDLSEDSGYLPTACGLHGKLGQTSTDFREPCKKSAPNIGIDSSESGETAPQAGVYTPFL